MSRDRANIEKRLFAGFARVTPRPTAMRDIETSLVQENSAAPPIKRAIEGRFLVEMMRVNGGRAPTLEEFLDFIYPDGVPEESAELDIDIPAKITHIEGQR